jgi:CheY-like chemotaxis protein
VIEAQIENPSRMPALHKRVLVAEDSPVTQDLLKLILSQRGHEVDIADDGEQALIALQRSPYDVALIDFRLPKMDGLQVAQKYRSDKNGGSRARLIAITADVEGLLAHKENCENFDQIIPKPLDIYEVCNVIERSASEGLTSSSMEEQAWNEPSGNGAAPAAVQPAAVQPAPVQPRPQEPSWALGLELMRWPKDFGASRRLGNAIPGFANLAEIDAILVHGQARISDLAEIWDRKPLHLFPIIDLGGGLGEFADYNASLSRHEDGETIRQLIQGFHHRRGKLHRDLLTTSDLGEKLLARLYVQDRPLKALYNADERSLTRFHVPLTPDEVMREAEKNCKSGFLKREFFDRFHVCYRCSSSRLHLREECSSCRSSQLKEEAYIHHFRCGTQAVEADFRDGDRLVCPKCRQELSHFSVDYDKPGTVLVCGRCGHAESEPTIGIICLDCSAHFESDTATMRDVHSYHMTQEGTAFVQMGYALRGAGQRTIRFSDLPLDFVVGLNAAAKKFNEQRVPFTVVNLSYENEREIIREAGLRQFGQSRDQFLENLRHLLRDRGTVVKGHSYDFCLIQGQAPTQLEAEFMEIVEQAGGNLRFDLGLRTHLFGHEDFA